MNAEFIRALDALEIEKNINKEELIEAIEVSIASAYKKNYGSAEDVDVCLDRETGEITVYATKEIVDEVENPQLQISLEEARKTDPNFEVGDTYRKAFAPRDFGRIAAQNAKQLIVQRIKEAERNLIYNEYLERQDEVLTGLVTRVERNVVYVDMGSGEAAMLPSEQVPGEVYKTGQRLKVYVLAVRKTTKGPQVNVSRTHPGLVKRLFESEVPEIYDGVVDIVSISREAGSRTKIAVKANDPSVDPVGACVGQKGIRVQSIINEINGEKLDIIKYSEVPEEYLANALSPAKVLKILVNKSEKTAIAVVDDFQLSLAIGKEGQNVRLAAKLTSWKIDIKNKTSYEKILEENPDFEQEYTAVPEEDDILGSMEDDLDAVLNISLDDDDQLFEESADILDDLVMTDGLDEE
ncbi:MAG: transcription termination factor NusA [Eubacterium sp.]|nr:transcription termination factor NusA [Eubacterium sp.]